MKRIPWLLMVLMGAARGVVAAAQTELSAPPTLEMEDAVAALDAQNLALSEARSRVAKLEAAVGLASAPLLPTVVVAGGYVRNSDEVKVGLGSLFQALGQPTPTGMPNTIPIQPLAAWSVAGTVKVPLLMAQAWADRGTAQHATEAASASTAVLRLQLRAALAQAGYAATAAEETVAASERAVATALEHRDTAQRLVDAGQAPVLSVLKADTELTKRRSDLARARAELGRLQLALGVMLGRPQAMRIVVRHPADLPSADTDALVREALGRRPELDVHRANLRIADSEARSARLRWVPQVSGSASVFASDTAYPTGKKEGWRLTLDASWPLFDGGHRSAKLAQAGAEGRAAAFAEESTRVTIAQEVADAERDVLVTKERLQLAERQVAFAAEAAASAKRTFEGGVAGSLDVLDANDRLYQAEVGLAEARGRLGMAHAALLRNLGRER